MQYTFPADIGPFADAGIFIREDGTRALSGDWDIGAGRMIKAEKIQARSNLGLALHNYSGQGIFIKDDGFIGIGTSDPDMPVTINQTLDLNTMDSFDAMRVNLTTAGVNSAIAWNYACPLKTNLTNNATSSGSGSNTLYASFFSAINAPGAKCYGIYGKTTLIHNNSNTLCEDARGIYGSIRNLGGGIITEARGLDFSLYSQNASSVIATGKCIYVGSVVSSGGSITTCYGIYIDALAGATKWGICFNDPANNYFAGNVGLAVTPTAKLHISSPNGQDALKIATGRGGDIVVDEWGNLSINHNGLGARYDSNLGQVSFNNANDLYISSGWNSASPFNILLMPSSTGKIGLFNNAPASPLDINANTVRLRTARTPASAGASGNQGEICWDASYLYVCVATNTWKRAALTSW
jgi:hypothetical protein